MITLSPILGAALETAPSTQEFLFARPTWLWALLLIPLLLLLRRRAGAAARIEHPTIRFIAKRLPRPSALAGRLGPICFSLAAAALILALAQPQWKQEQEEQKVSGIDIMIACDLSGSMASQDMTVSVQDEQGRIHRGIADRLTAAKLVINEFISGRPNDRIGLVAFAGKAKLCSPLTLDHQLVRYIIDQFYLADARHSVGYIQEDGTAIGTAIASAATRLHERQETKSKVIILVTDGASNTGTIPPLEAAQQAAELGIKIFTIAIGRDERISQYTANVDTFDAKTLREIARITGGRYFRASSGASLQQAFETIDRLEKTDATRRTLTTYTELFPYPVSLACLMMALGAALTILRPQPAP